MPIPFIEEKMEKYAKDYEGILPPEAIESSIKIWRAELTAAYEQGQQEVEDRIRKVATSRTRRLKIGQNEYARKQLNLTEKEIDDHNAYCEAWEQGYSDAKDDVTAALNQPRGRGGKSI